MWTPLLLLPLLLLPIQGEPTHAQDALGQLVEAVAFPGALRRHVEEVLADGDGDLDGAGDCLAGLIRWSAGLATLQPWALQMVDASSKLVTGVLVANFVDMGNFDECVAAGDKALLGWTGRYALPRVRVAGNGTGGLELRMAVCVPGVCRPAVLRAGMARAAAFVNARVGWTALSVALDDSDTAVAGPVREADTGDYLMIYVCAGLVLLVFLATALDLSLRPEDKSARQNTVFLLAFSLRTNGRRLLKPAAAGDFTCINGIRFLSAMWVVLGHRYMAVLQFPFMNVLTAVQRVHDTSIMIIINAPLSVDTFFLLGGLVNSYSFLMMVQKKNSFNFVTYLLHRYIRLTPAFALMMGITATWISFLGTGPLWGQVVGSQRGYCRDYWWSSLLYVANYVNPDGQCLGQSWYLMVDMQLHWLSPLLLYPLWKWGSWGRAWLLTVLAGSCAVPFALTYVRHLPTPFPTDLNTIQQFMREMYYPTHPRATGYVFGLLCGYALFLIKTERIRLRLTPIHVVLGWMLSAALCLTVIFTGHILLDHENHPDMVLESAFYAGLYRLGWSLGLAWVVFACILGYGGPINAFLSWRPFTVLGRLTYGIFLTHLTVQLVDRGSMRNPMFFSDFKMVEKMLSDVVISTVLGACLSMAVEAPISALEKHFRTTNEREDIRSMSDSEKPLPFHEEKIANGSSTPVP